MGRAPTGRPRGRPRKDSKPEPRKKLAGPPKPKNPRELEKELQIEVAYCYANPLRHVMLVYPWMTNPAIQLVDWEDEETFVDPISGFLYEKRRSGLITYADWMAEYRDRFGSRYGPDKWACEFLDDVGAAVRERSFTGKKAVKPIQFCMGSGHGVGKSAVAAWLVNWVTDTRPLSQGTITANTDNQLKTKTWAQIGFWRGLSLTKHWFTYSASRGNMSLRKTGKPNEWFCTAQTCREETSEAFAGQHAASSTSWYLFDEASAVPAKIFEVREGGLTDGEPMTFDFGNPTRPDGEFNEELQGRVPNVSSRCLDSREAYITNKAQIEAWRERFGETSDFFKVRVKGEPPSTAYQQFIPSWMIQASMARPNVAFDPHAALVIAVDVARFGQHRSVVYPVLGDDARSFAPVEGRGIYRGLDNVELAGKVVECIQEFQSRGIEPAAIIVDEGGTGSGVVDTLRHWGFEVIGVNFGSRPQFMPDRANLRADEIWLMGRDWLERAAILPNYQDPDPQKRETAKAVFDDLTGRQYGFTLRGEKLSLETKQEMADRGLESCDVGDALFMARCVPLAGRAPRGLEAAAPAQALSHDFDPYAEAV